MVGGKIHEIIPVGDKIWVNVVDRPYMKDEFCAIYVVDSEISRQMVIGDSLWWQGRFAMWTPQALANQPDDGKGEGREWDIQIPRIGYSGVSRPDGEATQ